MIPLAEINTVAEKLKVSPEVIEKDYVICWILFCLSKSRLRNDFIFYGGTAIKRIYFATHRFSEDIDLLSLRLFNRNYILKELEILQYAKEKANLVLQVNMDNIIVDKNKIQLYVLYSGYDEIIGAPKEIRIDFTMDMSSFGETAPKNVIESYSDSPVQHKTLSVMTLNTILANKLGLLIDSTRNEPRDLFDVWFLLEHTDQFDFDFKRVCQIFYEKYAIQPSFSIFKSRLMNKTINKNWNERLRKQMAELPSIDNVINEVRKKLHYLFIKDPS